MNERLGHYSTDNDKTPFFIKHFSAAENLVVSSFSGAFDFLLNRRPESALATGIGTSIALFGYNLSSGSVERAKQALALSETTRFRLESLRSGLESSLSGVTAGVVVAAPSGDFSETIYYGVAGIIGLNLVSLVKYKTQQTPPNSNTGNLQ